MFIILVSEDITTDNVGCIDIQSLPFEMEDNASGLIPPPFIMYECNTLIDGKCQVVLNTFFHKFQIQ